MKFILINRNKNRTKDVFIILGIIIISLAIFISIVYIHYKPAYKVTLAGNTIGFVSNKQDLEVQIQNYMNNTNDNIAYREIENYPEYEFNIINRNLETPIDQVMTDIQDKTITTYKLFSVKLNDEEKAILSNIDDANSLISELKENLNNEIEFNLKVDEIYTTDFNVSSKEDAKNLLNEIKTAKVTEYENKKAEEEKIAKAIEEEKQKKAEKEKATKATKEEQQKTAQSTQNNAKTTQSSTSNNNSSNSSWRLEIPKIGLKASIAEGTSPDILNKYIGHFSQTPKDCRNVGLAAHNGGYKVNYFSKLKNLALNDIIYYTYNGNTSTYSVSAINIIDSYNWSYLRYYGDERLTLITCVDNDSTHRRCVQATKIN